MPRTGAEQAGPATQADEESVLNFAPNLEPGSRLIDIEQAFRAGLTRVPDGFRIASPASFATVLGVSPLRCADALRVLVEQGLVRPDGDRFVVVRAHEATAAPARYASIEEHLPPGHAFEPFGRPSPRDHRPLAPGQTALDLFPAAAWARFETRTIRMLGSGVLRAADPIGFRPLREAIASWLSDQRGVRVAADELVLFGSRQQALVAVLGAFADMGNQIWLEDPADHVQLRALDALRLRAVPIGLGRDGIEQELAEEIAPGARGALVSPSLHFFDESGVAHDAMDGLDRWAQAHDGWVVADERGGGFALTDVKKRARSARTIVVGSFASIAFPGLPIAWAWCPDEIRNEVIERRFAMDEPGSMLMQASFADMMASGAFGEHLTRLKSAVEERLAALLDGLGAAWQGRLRSNPAGLVATLELASSGSDVAVAQAAQEQGLGVAALSAMTAGARVQRALVCGFAGTNATQTYRAAQKLAELLDRNSAAPRAR
ncbi:PLP-dependent aminotransferase family protein [Roseiterribacter gracilis]|uniref:GntR family transcriptional regulator n=1 Tax=Roseiterribacter gracilis TaxID=2812848 RepID=A0A8S8XFW6_9PROT|nr:GntR family transcriptional regulator [Rhodospirillales bacterium TMPK1]